MFRLHEGGIGKKFPWKGKATEVKGRLRILKKKSLLKHFHTFPLLLYKVSRLFLEWKEYQIAEPETIRVRQFGKALPALTGFRFIFLSAQYCDSLTETPPTLDIEKHVGNAY